MTFSGRIVLIPQYMRTFRCIGSDCEDTCCHGWRVIIDEDTYKRYQRVRDPELRHLLKSHTNRIRSNSSSESYGKIKMNAQGYCPFLSEEKLCTIQLKLGEEYLSHTCLIYPRLVNQVNGVLEMSATLSCPEAARQALLNPEKMEFDAVREPIHPRYNVFKTINTQSRTKGKKAESYFWELRIFTIRVLQHRDYALADRLMLLGLFFHQLEQLVQNGDVEAIPKRIEGFMQSMEDGNLRESLSAVTGEMRLQMKLLKEVADLRFTHEITNQRYLECYHQFLQGLDFDDDGSFKTSMDESYQRYAEAYLKYYEPFMQAHEYILENYLVNYVFKELFPCGKYETLFDEYVMFILHYALIKLHLIGMAAFHKGLTTDLALKLIQSFARTVEHNQIYLKLIYDELKAGGFTTLPYMVILIRQ